MFSQTTTFSNEQTEAYLGSHEREAWMPKRRAQLKSLGHYFSGNIRGLKSLEPSFWGENESICWSASISSGVKTEYMFSLLKLAKLFMTVEFNRLPKIRISFQNIIESTCHWWPLWFGLISGIENFNVSTYYTLHVLSSCMSFSNLLFP